MLGEHGFASALGARAAVVPAPVRRALLLTAFLLGTLCALWIVGAHGAQAQERPGGPVDMSSVGEASEDPGGSSPSLPLSGSLPDPAIDAGERAAEAVADTSEVVVPSSVDPDVLVERSGLGQQVRETVREASLPAPERAPEAEPAEVEQETTGETPVAGEERPVEREPQHEIDHDDTDTPRYTGSSEAIDEVTEHQPVEHASADSASQDLVGSASCGSTGTVLTGGAVAGHLASLGAPSPARGVFDIARHVLRAVPIDTAVEPVFLPD